MDPTYTTMVCPSLSVPAELPQVAQRSVGRMRHGFVATLCKNEKTADNLSLNVNESVIE